MNKPFLICRSEASRIARVTLGQYRGLLATLLCILLLQACRTTDDVAPTPVIGGKTTDQYTSDVATKWAALQLKLTKITAGFTPPVAARAFGYAGITMYESVVPGIPTRKSLVGQLQGLTALPQAEAGKTYNWALSANAAQAAILRSLYANANAASMTMIDSLETALSLSFKETDERLISGRSILGRKWQMPFMSGQKPMGAMPVTPLISRPIM